MAIVPMQRMNIFGLQRERKQILECIQAWGMMEVDIQLEDDSFAPQDTLTQRQQFDRQGQLLQQALGLLDRYAPAKGGLFASLAGKKPVSREEYAAIVRDQQSVMAQANALLDMEKDIAANKAAAAKLEAQIESLTPWLALDVALDCPGTGKTKLLCGTLPGQWLQADLSVRLAELAPEAEAYDVQILWQDRDVCYITLVCLQSQATALEDALRSCGFARPTVSCAQPPMAECEALRQQISQINAFIEKTEGQIREKKDLRQSFQIAADYYHTRADKYEVLGQLPQSKNTFLISGYVPAKQGREFAEKLEAQFSVSAELEELDPEEEAPVLLKNNSFGAMFEGVLSSFGLPGKGEIDPSFITACFYVFLFGLMLSDAAYGAIVSIACGFAILKFPRMGSSLKKSLQLFFWCGISTVFWGVMFGGYFGDAVNVISRVFFGNEVTVPAAWFVPINDPTRLLVYSMLFGLIHLFTGLGMKGYICIKHKDYKALVFDVISWALMLLGLIIMLLPTDLFYGISQMKFNFPAWLVTAGKVMAIVGALTILLMAARDNKKFGLRIALGAYDLYNITSWLSDVLSYSRLLALGLATGVIAEVVNQMGSMMGNSIVGIILFIIVFIAGHTLNLAINLLGAYVHTCRLQYVEFFGKFYEGTGRAFQPFRNETQYIDITEVQDK